MGCNVVEGEGEARGESVCEKKVFGSVSTGNLIPCQTAQAKAGEREFRKYKIGGVKLAGAAVEAVESFFSLSC